MIARKIWLGILLGTTIIGSGLDVRTEGKWCHMSNRKVPRGARVIYHVSAQERSLKCPILTRLICPDRKGGLKQSI